jgi:LmbE family N-acetylglucosaminyl deacetylase
LGCGGVIALHSASGNPVHVLVLCGDGSGLDGKRREAATQAAAILGAEAPRFAGFPENRSDTIPLGDLVSVIERTVNELKPATVYVCHGGNLNIDHQNAFRAAATALRPMPGSPVAAFYGYEIASSTDWAPPGFGETFRPAHFVEITSVLERKLAALEAYAFDMRPEPHARSIKAIENLARARGASVGVAAAVAFTVLRSIVRT